MSLLDWYVKQMFSIYTSFQAGREEKEREGKRRKEKRTIFLSSLTANDALANLLRLRRQPANSALPAALEPLAGLRACCLPGWLSLCEAGSSCRDAKG